ncbi:MAG: TPM domain-containing protein [Muribaculaceae bacterium]|nr:TPM domain-containing protein [Muribaculaceae bacterium]
MKIKKFILDSEQESIVKAIEDAEKLTSGEIRVHLEPRCKVEDPYQRAIEVFNSLKMYETKERNGVLIYIAFESHKFAIIGDKGINEAVPSNFWEEAKTTLASHLANGNTAQGLSIVIEIIGNSLCKYFPCSKDDINEQTNEISYGE